MIKDKKKNPNTKIATINQRITTIKAHHQIYGIATDRHDNCLICGSKNHQTTWTMSEQISQLMFLKCRAKNGTSRAMQVNENDFYLIFPTLPQPNGQDNHEDYKKQTTEKKTTTTDIENKQPKIHPMFKPKKQNKLYKQQVRTPNLKYENDQRDRQNDINIIQWNTDRASQAIIICPPLQT